MTKRGLQILAILTSLIMTACGGGSASQPSPPQTTLAVTAPTHILGPGEVLTLSAVCSGADQPVVHWTADAGTVLADGTTSCLYTAPLTPGTARIQADLEGHPGITASIRFTVVSVSVEVVGTLLEGPGWGDYFSIRPLPDGRILILDNGLNGFQIWDPAKRTCVYAAASPLHSLGVVTATLADGSLIQVAGGYPPEAVDPHSILRYAPGTDSWSVAGETYFLRMGGHTSTVMKDGRVLIIGGAIGQSDANPTMEIWDPVVGGVARVLGNTLQPRFSHSANLLPDGSVLVAGGRGGPLSYIHTEFITADLNSVPGPIMATERRGHNTVEMTNGQILMVGGTLNGDLEAYDIVQKTFVRVGTLNPGVCDYLAAVPLPGKGALVAGGIILGFDLSPKDAVQVYLYQHQEARTLAHLPIPIYGAKAILGADGVVYLLGGLDEQSVPRREVLAITVR